jgi:transposase
VLATGLAWADLPPSAGWGSGQTCWRRLRDWTEAGVWVRVHARLLAHLDAAEAIAWARASVDASAIRALAGGAATGRNPTDRGRAGTKHHVLGDRDGLPLAAPLTGANRHDTVPLAELLDAVPLRADTGGAKRPAKLHADKAYNGAPQRALAEDRGITPRFARKGIEPTDRLGRFRWTIERTFAWLHRFRRLRVRYERRADLHLAFLYLACTLITWRFCQAAQFCSAF